MARGVAALVLGWCWLAGVYLAGPIQLPLSLAAAFGFAAVLLGLLHRRTPGALLVGCGIAALLAGLLRCQAAAAPQSGADLAGFNGQVVQIRGVVVDEPVPRGRWGELTVATDQVASGGGWRSVAGQTLVRTDWLAGWRYGDRLELAGRLEEPPEFDGFSYRDYLARQGVFSVLRYPKVRLLAREQAPWPLLALSRIRASASDVLARSVAEPAGALAQGILLGERAGLPTELVDAFARTNTTHIIAISGMNLAVAHPTQIRVPVSPA